MPQELRSSLPRRPRSRQLLRRQLQDRFDRGPSRHIDQFIDRQPGLFDQIDHRQQALPVAAEKLRQSPRARWSFRGDGVIASLQGGSPFH